MTDFTFNQLVNIQQVHNLLESHHALSGMAYGVLDTEENTLVAVGWQDLCVRFHRVNPVSCEYCRESDAYIKAHLHDLDGDFIEYRCKNGLTDVAIPILIEGRHVATFYAGQFFFDDNRPDTEFFSRQAVALGFDQEEYLESLERVPVFSREFVRTTVVFLRDMVNVLSETGLINLERAKNVAETQRLLHELQVHQLEPEMQNEELFQSREKLEFTLEKYTDLYDFAPVSYVTLNHNGIISDVNLAGASLLGGERSKLIGRRFVQFVATADRPEFTTFIGMVYCSRKKEAIEIVLQSEGTIQFIVQIDAMAAASGQECRLALTNITERKRAEQELRKAFDFSEGVINAIPDLLFEIDRNGRYLNVWTQKTELLAAQKEFLLGKTVHDVLSPESAAIVIDSIREAEENGLSFGKVLRIDLTLGMRWFELSVSRKPGGGAA
ncbi:MAG: PocR ligand-binding domain-containing protein, partial [Desulfuromonadales bacterium]|nr:PocR ligand-binding domain-containing protein [Desulfuromonadales bacterium]